MKLIAHVADIHIHRKNHKRIIYAWKEFIEQVSTIDDLAIVVAGDIFEDKTKVYGTDIDVFNYMMGLVEKNSIQTIIIPGNHDFNDSSTDLISSVMENTNYKYVHLWSKSGKYELDNVSFYVYSPIDRIIPIIDPDDKGIKIALVHEPVSGSIFDNAYVYEDGRFAADQFKDYDIAMLGDIHKPQFLTPTVAYSGSLVQKSKSEGLEHGYILWDINQLCGKFTQLTNYFNDVIIKVKDNILVDLPIAVNPKSVVLEYQRCTPDDLKIIEDRVTAAYGRIDSILDTTNYEIQTIDGPEDIRDTNTQVNYLESILNDKGYTIEDRDAIMELHNDYSADDERIDRRVWNLEFLQWTNIYKYREYSFIDFRKVHGVAILCGENAIGKSSIIHILIYILFGGRSVVNSVLARDLILNNSNQLDGHIRCGIRYNDDEYIIHRVIKRKTAGDTVELQKNGVVIENGDIVKTYDMLKTIIGTRDDFLSIPVAGQSRVTFLDLSPKDKLQFVSRIIGIENLNLMVSRNKKSMLETKRGIKEISSLTIIDVHATNSAILEHNSQINSLDEIIIDLRAQKAKYYAQLSSLRDGLIPDLPSFNQCKSNMETAKNCLAKERYHSIFNTAPISYFKEQKLHLQMNKVIVDGVANRLGMDFALAEPITEVEYHTAEETIRMLESQILPYDISEVMSDAEYNNYTWSDLEIMANTKREKPSGYLIECDEAAPFELTMTKDSVIQQIKTLKQSLHKVIDDDEIREQMQKLSKSDVEISTYDISCKQSVIDSINAELNSIQSLKGGTRCDLIIDISQITNLQLEIRDLESRIVKVNINEINSLLAKLESTTMRYQKLEFSSHCDCCSNNKNEIALINGSDIISSAIKEKQATVLENARINKCIATNRDLLESYVAQFRYTSHEKIKILSNELTAIKEQQKYYLLSRDLILAVENRQTKYAISIQELYLTQFHENDKYAENKILREQWDNYHLYSRAINTINKISGDEARGKLYILLPRIQAYIIQQFDKMNLYITMIDNREIYDRELAIYLQHEKNNRTNLQIEDINEKTKELLHSISTHEAEKSNLTIIVAKLQTIMVTGKERVDRLSILTEELRKKTLYDNVMSDKKGIVSDIIRNKSTSIQAIWNKKLSDIADFRIAIDFHKDKFNVRLLEGDRAISTDVASGFQKFILDLTFRETIYKIAQIVIPSFLIIDEGFGTADESNRVMIKQYLKTLTNEYPFIFIISHIDELQTSADCKLQIEKKASGSHIAFGYLPQHDVTPKADPKAEAKAKEVTKKAMLKLKLEDSVRNTDPRMIQENTMTNVIRMEENLKYTCIRCDIKLNTRATAVKHLSSKTHLKVMVEYLYANQ